MSFCDRYAIDVSSVQDKTETKTKPPGFVVRYSLALRYTCLLFV